MEVVVAVIFLILFLSGGDALIYLPVYLWMWLEDL